MTLLACGEERLHSSMKQESRGFSHGRFKQLINIEVEGENYMVTKKNKVVEQGHSSRKKILLIEEAMSNCATYEDMFNRYKVCEQITELMVNKYQGLNLEYHSSRMGMDTTTKILKEIDRYFYREMKVSYDL